MSSSAAMASSVPPAAKSAQRIDLSVPRYDQSTYSGRVRHFLDVIDPFTLLTSDSQLKKSLQLLDDYSKGKLKNIDEEQVWKAKKTKDAIIHPDSGEKIFWACRMSAFVPINIPIVVGMLTARSPLSNIFWQWTNQTYNVMVNYANRNASNNMSFSQVAGAYAGAVLSSCGLSVGLNKVVERISRGNLPSIVKSICGIGVPYIAVASAGAVNVLMMRYTEAIQGVQVKDVDGNIVGSSIAAGKEGLKQVAATRVVLPAPILLFPPIAMAALDRVGAFSAMPKLRMPAQVVIITASLWAALPAAIGLFPQISAISVSKMEPQFQNLRDKQGNKIQTLYFNKGL